jgi:hypothetical protein
MRRLMLGVLAAVASVTMAAPPAAARTPHPWCMVVQDYSGVIACAFDSFEQCRVEARSGNEGFCMANPFYPATPAKPAHARRVAPR